MIIGIAALFSILFFGGDQEYFLVEDLEKGVKEYIDDTERRKETQADLKLTKSMIKAYYKARKNKLSEFHTINMQTSSSKESMRQYFDQRLIERKEFQEDMLERRLLITGKITDDEWKNIMEHSQAALTKKKAKSEKKESKDPFQDITEAIDKSFNGQENQQKAQAIFSEFKLEYTTFLIDVNKINSLESDLLVNKNTTATEFQDLATKMNNLRKNTYYSLIDLHFNLLELEEEEAFVKVMKTINKSLIQ